MRFKNIKINVKNATSFSMFLGILLVGMFLGILGGIFFIQVQDNVSSDVNLLYNKSEISGSNLSNTELNSINTLSELYEISKKINQNYDQRFLQSLNGFAISESLVARSDMMEVSALDSSSTQSSKVSSTNNQVSTVDEADIVKLNENYTFVIPSSYNSNIVNIIKFDSNGEMNHHINITYNIKDSNVDFNYLLLSEDNNYLFIFGNYYEEKYELNPHSSRIITSYIEKSIMLKVDISSIDNENSIEVVNTMEFSQSINDIRLFDSTIYITFENFNIFNYPQPFFTARFQGDIFMPPIQYLEIPQNPKTLTFGAIPIENFENSNFETYLIDSSSTLYLNEGVALITYQNSIDISFYDISKEVFISKFNLNSDIDEREFYEQVNSQLSLLTEKEIENLNEEINELYSKEYQKQYTSTILKFNINKENFEFVKKNSFQGRILNQFSINERNGVVSIASEVDNYYLGDELKETHVYTFDEDLNELDVLRGIAPGEDMYSSRFYQDVLYLVTFEEIDPFFVIDLKDPNNIEILGELKIPGFSEYLHPLSDSLVLGIGKDTKEIENEWDENSRIVQNGVKISLFDVSSFSNPKEIDILTFGNSWGNSLVSQDHKAFIIDMEKEYIVVPMQFYEDSENYNYWYGAVVINYSNNELTEIKRLDHSNIIEKLTESKDNEESRSGLIESSSRWFPNFYDSRILRTTYVDSTLYTYSSNTIVSHDIDNDFKTLDALSLIKNSNDDEIYFYR